MKTLKKIIDVVYKKNHNEDYDTVWALTGDEGSGKSNLGLNILDYWATLLNGFCSDDIIKNMCLESKAFITNLTNICERLR